ncbi:hypothetical protein LCGC14_3094220, partial [marine sediment metagenome]
PELFYKRYGNLVEKYGVDIFWKYL